MTSVAHKIGVADRTDDVRLKDILPFEKMILSDEVKKGLAEAGFVYPTVLQSTAIPIGKSGMDLLVQAKSGTGKTVIYCTIIVDSYASCVREPQSLVIVPTREIAVQTEHVLNQIGKFAPGFRAVSVIGGMEVSDDRKKLQNAKAVIGTPGRLLHLIQSEIINTSKIRLFVIDEADTLLKHFLRPSFDSICKSLSAKKQTIALSATFADNVDKDLATYMKNPLLVTTDNRGLVLLGIKQFVFEIPEQKTSIMEISRKVDGLRNIFGKLPFKQCLLFTSSQSRAESYRNYLEKDGWPVELISGAQSQQVRLEVFKKFREFKTRILVTTDLMARGVDSENTNLVINLELPNDAATYLHRMGRAGRFGTYGITINFIASTKDKQTFTSIMEKLGASMNVFRFPQMTVERDLWDFSDVEKDTKHFGRFGDPEVRWGSDDGDKENVADINLTHSIDTQTFHVDLKEAAKGVLELVTHKTGNSHKVTPESRQSSSQKLPSSNTIDDASSIAVDSDVLRSTQQEHENNEPDPTDKTILRNLMNLLFDQGGNHNKDKVIDPFEDYTKALENSTSKTQPETGPVQNAERLEDLKAILIEKTPQQPTLIKKDIYSDYDNYKETSPSTSQASRDDVDKATYILSVDTPSALEESSQELESSPKVSTTAESNSVQEVKHFPSPVKIESPKPALVVAAAQNESSSSDSSSEVSFSSDGSNQDSSGFDENSTTPRTSGIDTTIGGTFSIESYDDESPSYVFPGDEDSYCSYITPYAEDGDCEDLYSDEYEEDDEDSEDDHVDKDTENDNNKRADGVHCNNLFAGGDSEASCQYQQAYNRWVDIYWNQLTLVRDYTRFSTYIRNNL